MNKIFLAGLALGVLLVGTAGLAQAQVAAPPVPDASAAPAAAAAAAPMAEKAKAKPKHAMAKAAKPQTVTVTISNKRAVPLTSLDAMPSAGGDTVALAGALAAGKTASAKVPHGKDCHFDLHGAYEDGSTTDVPGVDLCKDKAINLVE